MRRWNVPTAPDDDSLPVMVLRNDKPTVPISAERVPEVGYENSCIFHGKQGCTLDRSLRSDVCNSYFCGGLQGYLTGDEVVTPTMIIAGVGDRMRTSPILMP